MFMDKIILELTELNRKVSVIIGIMQKPENIVLKIMGIIGSIVAISGILSAVEIVRNWILGG